MSTDRSKAAGPVMRGQFVVVAMLVVAVAAATFAWWWNYNRGHKALEFFGPEAATLVRTAPRVELLDSASPPHIDISKAPGLLNARTSLLSDASYEWDRLAEWGGSAGPKVRFSDGARSVEVAFDFESRAIRTSSTGRTAALTKKTADGWKAYLSRQEKAARSVTE